MGLSLQGSRRGVSKTIAAPPHARFRKVTPASHIHLCSLYAAKVYVGSIFLFQCIHGPGFLEQRLAGWLLTLWPHVQTRLLA